MVPSHPAITPVRAKAAASMPICIATGQLTRLMPRKSRRQNLVSRVARLYTEYLPMRKYIAAAAMNISIRLDMVEIPAPSSPISGSPQWPYMRT